MKRVIEFASVEGALQQNIAGLQQRLAQKKDKMITLRVTEDEKARIEATASELGMSVAAYFLRLHDCVTEALPGKSGRKAR